MADFAPNYTARYRLRYTAAGKQHTMLFRGATKAVVDAAPFVGNISAFLNALAPSLLGTWAVIGADVAEQDSDIFLPASVLPVITASRSGTPGTAPQVPRFCSFVGKTALGHGARIYVFGVSLAPEGTESANYRFEAGENANLDAAILQLQSWTALRGPDLAAVSWYSYANYGLNAYYQRKARRV